MRSIETFTSVLCTALALAAAPLANAELTLDEAIRRTLERNPRLASMSEAHLATTGRRIDAGARPNPELSFEAENVRFDDSPGSRTTSFASDSTLVESEFEDMSDAGFAGSELTLSVSQMVELGGKRARRIAVADRETQAALWDYEVARSDALAQTRQAFVNALAAQENAELRARLAQLSADALAAVVVRVESGKDSPVLSDRAAVEAAQARIALAAAQRRSVAARYALAAQWDDREPDFDAVSGALEIVPALPSREALYAALDASPAMSRWAEEVALRDAAVDLARAQRAPDLTLSLGWRGMALPESEFTSFDSAGILSGTSSTRPEDDWDHSLVFGVSVPLPLFNRARGQIVEAEHLALQASHERRAAHSEARMHIAAALADVEAAYDAVAELREHVLPAAGRAHDAAELGFESGKFTYLEALDAQRTLFEVEAQYIDALAAYHHGIADLERIVGTRLEANQPSIEGNVR